MTRFALSNCNSDSYRWLSDTTVKWISTDMIPIGAFSQARGDTWLMIGKEYAHSVDESNIPSSIKICIHYSNGRTGPINRSYGLWSEEQHVRMNNDDRTLLGYQISGKEVYVLPVMRSSMLREIQYCPRGTSFGNNNLPTITSTIQEPTVISPKQQGPVTSPKQQGPLMLDLRIETVTKCKPVRDYC